VGQQLDCRTATSWVAQDVFSVTVYELWQSTVLYAFVCWLAVEGGVLNAVFEPTLAQNEAIHDWYHTCNRLANVDNQRRSLTRSKAVDK
jgi:hypothetical protein